MGHPASAKHENLATRPYRKIKVKNIISRILLVPGRQRIIIYSWEGSFRVWDLEKDTQVEEWEDKDFGVQVAALSPGGKTLARGGNSDGAVKLWNVDTGKVIKTLTGHAKEVEFVCWSPDGERAVSGCNETLEGSEDGVFRVWDVGSGETIIGPIKAGEYVFAVCYSPDGKMIAMSRNTAGLKIWNANSGELLKTFEGGIACLAWEKHFSQRDPTSTQPPGLFLTCAKSMSIRFHYLPMIAFSHNTVQLWNLETNQHIGRTPLHHQGEVNSATCSADGKFLVTSCNDSHIYAWDVSAIVKEAGLPSDIVSIDTFSITLQMDLLAQADVTPRPAPNIKDARRIPPGFF
ncbi:WD40 repeat-like protein [Suillus weaverae]|nr:WD40 repeat-like protein [Suillus weaverae]